MSSYGNYLNRLSATEKKKKKEQEEAYIRALKKYEESQKQDIAPVKTTTTAPKKTETKKKDDDGFFKKSNYFADGSWDKGDLINTIRGSITDLGEWFTKGAVGSGEKMLDNLAMMGTTLGNAQLSQISNDELAFSSLKNIGKDKKTKEKEAESIVKKYETAQKDAKKGTAEFVVKDLYDEGKIAKKIISAPFEKRTGINTEEASVFGAKSRSLAESTGNMLTTKLIGTILGGGMGNVAVGLSAGGGEIEEALKQGATFEGAMASGMITAAGEIAGNQFFNGVKIGGHTLTEGAVQSVARAFSGKTLQTLTKWGINTAGEGAEEVLSDFMSAVGQKLTYLNEKEFNELFNKQDAWDSFLGGMVLGGVFEGVDVASSKITGTDYVTGLTKTEQKVVDKVVEDRIAEEEKDGKKLKKRDKEKIYDEVVRILDKGGIDTDTIESVLGGEEYETYKRVSDARTKYETTTNDLINKLQEEYDTLYKMKNGDKSDEQIDRQAKLLEKLEKNKADLEEFKKDTRMDDLKTKLSQNVSDLVKDSRLAESYREVERNKQKFEADTSKYKNENARQTVQNAINSGFFGNSNASHEFVDFAAKLSEERGYEIDFLSTEDLEELRQNGNEYGLISDTSRIEAFVSDNHKKIVINTDTVNKGFDSLIGHEITHTLEQAKSYKGLAKAVKKYLGEEEYNKLIEKNSKRYEGTSADIEKEIVADFCGERLLTDYEFVKHLSINDRNVFQKIYDEIKYLCKIATAGSKEARELERVKRNFEKAYRESAKTKAEIGTKYSVSGVNSKTANGSLLLKAEHMLDTGVDSETVRQETGWYKGYDGKMRFEIDDSKSELIENPNLEKHESEGGDTYFTGRLSDILNHSDLYDAYPQLQDVNIVIQPTEIGTRGIYQPKSNYITLSLELFKRNTKEYEDILNNAADEIKRIEQTAEFKEYNKWYEDEELSNIDPEKWLEEEAKARDTFYSSELGKRYYHLKWGRKNIQKTEFGWNKAAKEVLMHEIQHAVQKIEHFASGSSPEYWKRKADAGFTIKTEKQKAELIEAEKEYYAVKEEDPTFYSSMLELIRSSPDMPRGKIDWETLEQIEDDPIEWQEFDKKRDALEEKYGAKVFDFMFLHDRVKRLRNQSISPNDAYYSTAGEIEARDTANRLNLNAEQRKNTRPDIDRTDVVFSEGRESYEIKTDAEGDEFVEVDEKLFNPKDGESHADVIRRIIKERFNNLIDANGQQIQINKTTNDEWRKSGSARKLLETDAVAFDDKLKTIPNADEILKVARKWIGEEKYHSKNSDIVEFARGNVRYRVGTNGYAADVIVGIRRNGAAVLYDLVNIQGKKITEAPVTMASYENNSQRRQNASVTDILPQNSEKSSGKTDYSLSAEQEEYFKDSKVRDENGNLKVMYHGTSGGGHTVFDTYGSKYGLFGTGSYFTDNKEVADSYTKKGWGENPQVYESYLNITNPLDMDAEANPEEWKKAFDFDDIDFPESGTNEQFFRAVEEYYYEEMMPKWEVAEIIRETIESGMGYDGLTHIGGGRFNKKDDTRHRVYIAFEPEQIKNVDNIAPTNSADIRHSLSEEGEAPSKYGRFFGKDLMYRGGDIAPVTEGTVSKKEQVGTVNEDDYAPMTEEQAAQMFEDDKGYIDTFTDADMPPEIDAPIYSADTTSIKEKSLKDISAMGRDILFLTPKERRSLEDVVQKYSTSEVQSEEDLFNEIKKLFGERTFTERIEEVADIQQILRGYKIYVSPSIKGDIADYTHFMRKNFGKIIFSKEGLPVDTAYMELSARYPNFFPSDIVNPSDQLQQMSAVANMVKDETLTYELDDDVIREATETITEAVSSYKEKQVLKTTEREGRAILRDELKKDKEAQREEEKARKQAERDALNELSPLERYKRKAYARLEADKSLLKEELDEAEYNRQVKQLEEETEKKINAYKVANRRKTKQQEYRTQMEALMGDTSTWKDKKLGISYEVNTLRRNLRDVVRDANGKRDIAKADAIYDELQGKYNHNEAELNRDANRIKQKFAEMKITKAEDRYIQMLGEFRHNPETTLTEDDIKDYLEKHKKHIDEAKVDKVIEDARTLYDDLLVKVNKVLSEQGMKEIPYRKGYFPHFREEKQGFLGKLFNWKTKDNDIPTSIAGLTEMFEPNRSWQSFNKQRTTDETEYSFLKGLDSYVQGSLDWIYHIEDIQKRRAFENHIRYTHSEEGIKEKVDAIFNSEEYDADEMQEQIDLVYREANNPLNNFIQDFHTATNSLAGKKSSMDRAMEQKTNRKIYSVMTNLSNRVSGNMVAGSVSSALTNFIPITQSWVEVSPVSSLRAMGETIVSTIRDDGTVNKSDFLTNRLNKSENLYKTTWDKVGEGVSFLMDAIDNFTSQTVWRSKYIQNMSKGMSESEAVKNADIFAANVMADRSRGNQPTIFDSKSPLTKVFTAFQLEVNNQYGYFFKDAPQDIANKSKARLITGYATAFLGAYAYNSLYSAMTGRNAAFDPIRIIEELMKDLGFGDDDEEEEIAPVDVIKNLANNIVDELPFISGLAGGGRIPISSALPYGGVWDAWEGTLEDFSEGNYEALTKEWLSPVYYLAMPMGGGQIRKTQQGLGMFSDDHPVSGSYTDSGNLRFPVEDNLKNRIQAGVFGQYASENARTYFDEGYAPLKEKQIKEYADVEMPIKDYWQYREDLKGLDSLEEKFDFIAGMDLPVEKKNILINNIVDRKEKVDLENYDDFENYEEFDFYAKNTEKYNFLQDNGVSYKEYKSSKDAKENYDSVYSWWKNNPEKVTFSKAITDNVIEYRGYTSHLDDIRADKDSNGESISGSAKAKKKAYIWSLPIDEGQKILLYRSLYDSKKDRAKYDGEIVDYLESRDDISYDEMFDILEELDFTVDRDTGRISW